MLHKQYYTENNQKQDDLRLGVQYLNPLLQYRTVTKKIFDFSLQYENHLLIYCTENI